MWTYQVITVRDKDKTKGAEAAHQVHHLLVDEHIALSQIPDRIKDLASVAKSTKVTTSEEYHHQEKEVSAAYKDILKNLKSGTYSEPQAQKSRADNSTVYRIFYMKEVKPGGVIPFNEISSKIKDKLLDEAAEKETTAYLKKLRKHFDVQDNQELADFEPFQLG
jgi:hypothetical protein